MKRRRISSVSGLLLVTFVVLIVSVGAGPSGGGSKGLRFDNSLGRVRARNLHLESMITLVMKRRVQAGGEVEVSPTRPAKPAIRTVSRASEPEPDVAEATSEEGSCDPNYEGQCLDAEASDYDCAGGDGDGPDYTGEVRVVGEDHFGLDADGDGVGCEAE